MATKIRNKISKSNPYYISKERYLELSHFCMQYKEFEKRYRDREAMIKPGCKTEEIAIELAHLSENMQMIKLCTEISSRVLSKYLFKAVTEGKTYTYFLMNTDIPCGKNTYYKYYRKFFCILDRRRG